MAGGGFASGIAEGFVKECQNVERLQPFYIMIICSSMKFILTIIVFKIDTLKPASKLHEEWRKTDFVSIMKRVAAIFFQLAFIAMAVKTTVDDFVSFRRAAEGSNIWQQYTCGSIRWNASVNVVAAWSTNPSVVEAKRIVQRKEAYLSYDPRPFGWLCATKFYLKLAYGQLMMSVVLFPATFGMYTHGLPGCAMFMFCGVWEFFKFVFFSMWRDLFTLNFSLLWADALNLWVFAYPFMLITGAGLLCIFPLPYFVCWWHGVPTEPLWELALTGTNAEVSQESDAMSNDVSSSTSPQGMSAPSAEQEDSPLASREVFRRPELLEEALLIPTSENPKPLRMLTFYSLVVLVANALGAPIAARVYQGDGIYNAIQKTVAERSISQYLGVLRTSIGGVEETMHDRLSAACDAMWAIF